MRHVVLCVLLAAGLAGCASTPTPTYVVDEAKVAAIERAAVRTGVQVIWVNKPVKAAP